jgi:hypothetical protein
MDGPQFEAHQRIQQMSAETVEQYTSPFTGEVYRGGVCLTASETSDQRNHQLVGTGSAVSPIVLCLSAQGYRQDRSDDHATLDGLKPFPSLVRLCLATRLGRSLPGASQAGARTLRPVSQATGVSALPHT